MINRPLIIVIAIAFVGCKTNDRDEQQSVGNDGELIFGDAVQIETNENTIDDDSTLLILDDLIIKNKDTCKTKFYSAIKTAWMGDFINAKIQLGSFFENCETPNKYNGYYRIAGNTLYELAFKEELVSLKKAIQVLVPKLDSLDFYPVSIFIKNEDGTHSLVFDGEPQTGN